ncbi:B-cell receptor CD22-like isoform X2 [Rhinichthys klamathensis goyatoka]|uniref:B-cell receptor CD22-like isoform X2 n=1 Tax=Rhinichthys klamathensis goyatoka TaxID=3034132 RepID=UPI0024B52390|nr:B-cell receptor CD22-like isoform X2 [Rhinichthys klamathensis goyatoka]
MFGVFSLISLLVIPGICSREWKVQYTSMSKCVLKGSTTHLSGTFKHPDHLTVTEIFWVKNPGKDKVINLLNLPDYRGRVEYFPSKDRTFILRLSNVRREDEGNYCIRILTNEERERFLGFPGIELSVTELRVEIPEEVVEKDSPVLFCKSTCNLSDRTDFIWYKNGESFSESSDGNRLILQSVSRDDTGNYSCAARDQEHLPSPAVTLSVRYPPQSVSVWVSGSGVIVEGDSVTLNCSSDSNPPALNFSWFKEKETSAVGSGQSFSISSFNSSFSGRFYCEAQNKYGSRRSASVSLFVSATSAGGLNTGLFAAAGIGAALIAICAVVVVIQILRKRVTPSEEQNHRASQHHKTVESPEDAYMTLDPKSRCSEYDTLDNMKRSCDTDDPEDQDCTYYNMDK